MSLLRNLATSLINAQDERLITTLPKAKELRPFVERAITLSRHATNLEGDNREVQAVHLRRQAATFFHSGNRQQKVSTGRRDEPYLVGRVNFFEDEEEEESYLEQRAEEVSTLFMRIARAVRIINDERASLPDLPQTKPEHLSFLVAAAMELETEVKLELLELRYTSERLKRLRDLLARATPNYEERARIHAIAKQNGHGGKKIDLE